MFCCKNICIPSFGLIPKIKCVGKYPNLYRQGRSAFDSHDPVDLIRKKEAKSKISLQYVSTNISIAVTSGIKMFLTTLRVEENVLERD